MEKRKDEQDYGVPIAYDPDFNGPLKRRSCTDILCLALFVVFIGVWGGIGLYAIFNGDPNTLLVPKDSAGRRCGRDTDVLNKPYLLFHDLTKCFESTTIFTGCKTPQVCVSRCPSSFYVKDHTKEPSDLKEYCTDDPICPNWLLPSSLLQKRCLPNLVELDGSMIDQLTSVLNTTILILEQSVANIKVLAEVQEVGQAVVEDIVTSWWKIVIAVVLALILSILYIVLLRWLAAPMVWISIFGAIAGLGAGLYFTVRMYIDARNAYTKSQISNTKYEEEVYANNELKTTRDLWLTGVIILSIVLLIILLVLIFLRKRIVLAIALIKEGSKAVSSVTSALIFPIIPWILQLAVIGYALVVGVYLASTGTSLYKTRNMTPNCTTLTGLEDNVECDPQLWKIKTSSDFACQNSSCKFLKINSNVLYPYLHGYNVFGFFWLLFFVIAFGQMVLAGVFAQWYWTFKKTRLPFFAVTSAFFRTLRYHVGTLAFGSLIIAICRIIRVILEYADNKLKKYDNEITRAIMCVFKCFFYCLEKFLRFLNKNAYIMCSIHGKNFCVSAKDAFLLLLRNILRVWVLDKVTDFLFFLSKILLTLAVGAISYVFFVSKLLPTTIIDNSDLRYGIVPVIIIMICTYLIASLFFSVYSMAVDTLFLCFLEDCERNDGSPEKPYYMSKNLMKIFGKKNKMD